MDKHAIWKWLVLVVAVCLSLGLALPLKKKIKLGLDLRGGTSFTLQVVTEGLEAEAKRHATEQALEVIRNRVDRFGIAEPVIYTEPGDRIVVQIPGIDEEKRQRAEQLLRSVARLEFRLVHEKNEQLIEKLFEQNPPLYGYRKDSSRDETGGGARDVYVRSADQNPDTDEGRAKYLADVDNILKQFRLPRYDLLMEKEKTTGRTVFRPYFVKRDPELGGEFLKNAGVGFGPMAQPYVSLTFDSKGTVIFRRVTKDYAPGGDRNPNPNEWRCLAIVMDGTLYSAPRLKTPIYDGRAQIEGKFSREEAELLANVLRTGALPAPVKVIERRTVDPSLGRDSVNSGTFAVIVGGIAVLLFMGAYYLVNGAIANFALILNMVLMPIAMVITQGVLGVFSGPGGAKVSLPVITLPGIAGIALTIGMAVDANVLIFERMREEASLGKRLWATIEAGYHKAFSAILDSNLTTVLTGVVLFIYGSGPIRGFAVTMIAGIMASMFTAIVITRLVFNLIAQKTSVPQLKMFCWIREPKVDWLAWRKFAFGLSLTVIVATWILMVIWGNRRPDRVLGVDFLGGSSVTWSFANKVPVEKLRDAVLAAGITDANIQYQAEMEAGGKEFLQVKTGAGEIGGRDKADIVKSVVSEKFGSAGFKVLSEDAVGPQVGRELTRKALKAIVISLIGMIIYISVRFKFAYAMGATAAVFHDVLVTAGVYCLLGKQLSVTVVAALLTIIGYSVNDTIVIFDRIRENIKLHKGRPMTELCNLSMNQCMSRTLLTSLTVFLTVISLLVFGGGSINDFALTMFIGLISGTYSTVYVATPIMLMFHREEKPAVAK